MWGTAKATAIGLFMAAVLAAPALAEGQAGPDCGGQLVDRVLKATEDLRAGELELDELLSAYGGAAVQCPDNPYALHYASLAHFTQAQELSKRQQGADAIMPEVEKAFEFNQSFWALEDRDRKYTVVKGSMPVEVSLSYDEKRDLRTALISALLDLHVRAGKPHPYLLSDEVPEDCGDAFFYDVLGASQWLSTNPKFGRVAVLFSERLSQACQDTDGGTNTPALIRKTVARMQLSWASEIVESDPDTARELVSKIKAHRDSVLKPGETTNYNWDDYTASRLARIESSLPASVDVPTEATDPLVSAGPIAQEDWFTGAADEAQVRESMGRTLDAYYSARGIEGFVSAIGKMYAATLHAPDRKAACHMIYLGALDYQQGSWRSKDTKDATISNVAFKWLEDYDPAPVTDSQ